MMAQALALAAQSRGAVATLVVYWEVGVMVTARWKEAAAWAAAGEWVVSAAAAAAAAVTVVARTPHS